MADGLAPDTEERVQFALAAARIGVWEWDLRTDGVQWSSATPAFGLTPEMAPKTGRAFFELVHPGERSALRAGCDRAIREGTDLVAEFRTITADGMSRWIQTHARVAYDADGKACRLLGVNIDISERISFQEQLREARAQDERLSTLKATMRTVHDIVGNALMSLQLFRRDAEQHVSAQSLESFDQIVNQTADKLKALGDLDQVVETQMIMGMGIRYKQPGG